MAYSTLLKDSKVIVRHENGVMRIILNRPNMINSLDLEMIRLIKMALDEAEVSEKIRCVILLGNGEKGFCAGGDIKAIAQAIRDSNTHILIRFFEEEYALDLKIHNFPKPVILIANGITMGGGLGLAAGADIVVATDRTLMAMPETRIGFFPDVGATGWMFTKCPMGYPEFIGLTGYEMVGAECVRLGFASYLVSREKLKLIPQMLEKHSHRFPSEKSGAVQMLRSIFDIIKEDKIPTNAAMDEWVRKYFSGKTSLTKIMASLSTCSLTTELCKGVFQRLSERSPTAMLLTLQLLRHNEGRALDEVFKADAVAARFILNHPDYFEGVRARILDKDDKPRWQPDSVEKVRPLELNF